MRFNIICIHPTSPKGNYRNNNLKNDKDCDILIEQRIRERRISNSNHEKQSADRAKQVINAPEFYRLSSTGRSQTAKDSDENRDEKQLINHISVFLINN